MLSELNFDFSIFNSFQRLYFLLNEEGDIIKINSSAKNKLGFAGDSLIGKSIKDITLSSYREELSQLFKYERSGFTDLKLQGESGVIDVRTELAQVNIQGSNYFIFAGNDVTEHLKREEEFRRFHYVVDKTIFPLQITDMDGRMIYVNPAFIQASGYTKEELIGNRPSIFGSGKHSKRFWSKMWDTIKKGKIWVGEVENRKKSGEPFYTQLLISPILDYEGNVSGFFGVHRDLSEKRMLEKQLVHTQKMESIGTLAAGVAHEVGNPLASISALVQVIQRTTDDKFIKDKLELVKSQVTRISKIIRDLVDFSRPSNYELHLTDINENLTEAIEIVKVGAKAKNITYEINLDENLPNIPLIADQVQQVFVNILLNAVDAIKDESNVNQQNKIFIMSSVNGESVVVEIKDTGKGMPEEHQAKVFEPFFTTKKEGKGTGLGLWVSYGIVKSFQGDIIVRSKEGEGTTFTIYLPIQN